MIEINNFTTIKDLPNKIPLFLVRGAVLMPKGHLPVPLFETGQIPMLQNCINEDKMLGLIQPSSLPHEDTNQDALSLFTTGCLARITDVSEHESARLIIALEGICRFKLISHEEGPNGCPVGFVDYQPFEDDLVQEYDFNLDRSRLFAALKPYFNSLEITPNWEEISRTSNQRLVSSLSMACPLRPSEKQILLETQNLKEQSEIFTKLIEMSSLEKSGLREHNDTSTYH